MYVSGGSAYVAEDEFGLQIIDVTEYLGVDGEQDNHIPTEFSLSAAFPNPFNSSTTIAYTLPFASPVNLSIFDQSGRKITTLLSRYSSSGYYQNIWKPDMLPSGIYLIHLEGCGDLQTRKVVLTR